MITIWPRCEDVLSKLVNRLTSPKELLLRLAEKFPLSPRVSVIEGMMLEAKREFGLAERLYNNLLEEDPTNVVS